MAGKYKINRSNYTIRKKHQLTSQGAIFERDFMATTNLGPWDSGSIPYGEGNFKFRYRNPENVRRKPRAGSWLISECAVKYPEFWSGECISKTGVTEEKQIQFKPNYNSLLDFAYYGSCQELVKSTVRKIVEDFPGEVNSYPNVANKFKVGNTNYYLVNNPFGVDLFDRKQVTGIKDFVNNYNNYYAIVDGIKYDITGATADSGDTSCPIHGHVLRTVKIAYGGAGGLITISDIVYDNSSLLFTTSGQREFHIRPKDEYVEKFFNEADDFTKVLLNRDSEPIYTAVLDWPHDTDYGVMTYKKSFTWPLDEGGWNLDVSSVRYSNYIENLLNIAEFYDEGYTDNLWRMLTHDSIKSMDLAFSNPAKDEDQEDYTIGATRLEGLLWAYGRQFDELKRAIDNMKFNSKVSYDENNNMPDYFLSDSLELSGWEVYNVDNGIQSSGVTIDWGSSAGNCVKKTFSSEDANNVFLRALKLNSKEIFSKKGTREGIESLLGLFGLKKWQPGIEDWDYDMTEHVATVKSDICRVENNENLSMSEKLESLSMVSLNKYTLSAETSNVTEMELFNGLPYTFVETDSHIYVIPWFENGIEYYGNTYFQMDGGWGKNLNEYGGVYDETLKYISVVDAVHDLFELPKAKRYEGAICFVEDISELDENDYDVSSEYAHYFILKNKDNYDNVGNDAWRPALSPEDKGFVDYVEKIVDDMKANNPHVGYGRRSGSEDNSVFFRDRNIGYDDGKKYLKRLRYPFKYLVENDSEDIPMFTDGAYDCNGVLDGRFNNEWLELEENVADNKKVWMFGDVMTQDGGTKSSTIDYDVFDFENGDRGSTTTNATEPAANSVINVKTLDFVFRTYFFDEFKKYLLNVVLPYLKQVIPSTVIWTWVVERKDAIPVETRAIEGIKLTVDGVAYRAGDDWNDDYLTNYQELHDSRNWNNSND